MFISFTSPSNMFIHIALFVHFVLSFFPKEYHVFTYNKWNRAVMKMYLNNQQSFHVSV